MKKTFFLLTMLLQVLGLSTQTSITFVPQWSPQAQFAGYYMALEKGYYAEEGLDVTIEHIGVNSSEGHLERLMKGNAQIVGQQLMQSIIARSKGAPIVNVMQLTQVSGLCCVSHNPLETVENLDGLRIGKWKAGYSEFCDMMEVYKKIKIDWVPFVNSGTNLYVFGAVDATLCYTYSELISLKLAIGDIPEENVLHFSDFGFDCPEDGLYVTEKYYEKNKSTVDAFVRASKKGWEYAHEHRDEALALTLRYCRENNIVTNEAHQSMMLDEYLKLQENPASGAVDFSPVSEEIFQNILDALEYTGYITDKPDYNDFLR